MIPVLLILGCVLLVFLCYVMTAAESAFVYLSRADAKRIKESPRRTLTLLQETGRFMFAVRFWRVIFETAATVLFFLFVAYFAGVSWLATIITVLVMSAVGFVFFSTAPRQLGRANSYMVFRFFGLIITFFGVVLGPLPDLMIAWTKRRNPTEAEEKAGYFTEEELREFVDRATISDAIEDEEAQMVHSIFEMDETFIRSLMVPRTDMVTVGLDEDLQDALHLMLRSGYSRVPVLGETVDDVQGLLYLKDVTQNYVDAADGKTLPTVAEVMREPRFEPESKRALELLQQMQSESTHVAIVIDEYGGTAGLVTLEDLIEELVGEIADEYDNDKPEVVRQEDGTFKISSRLSIEELGETLDVDLEDEEVETVGGLLSKHLGRVPIIGSEVVVEGLHIRAIGTQGRRNQIATLLVWAEPKPAVTP
ncbi:hemolysin family protein [Rothia sp. ZJ1223]|uniref:hemolysin family protein n=1 Tax=Rothia sp. ZJ1223 TaxID=2811098 RepID=UPI00195B5884|nr:HlyC/CorC family transporter [Rothia sp. ZJ1223]